ncbi:MAG TPA: lysylphosphatidylglycerol synthase transmembrane domain-containing protein [Pyrinomonadaceae bacterium]|nr:lysylphosphatidylglycerol synthase transmembrane domain-containing protein [Pyrinomonadaceae bacterium]
MLVLLAVVLLWWFGRGLDWARVRVALRQSDWRLIGLACVVVLVAYWWRTMRWRSFLAPLCKARLREVWVATTVGFGAVFLIGRTGEVVRPVVLPMRDRRVRPAAAFVTIMIERVYDFLAVIFFFALNLLWMRPPAGTAREFGRIRQGGMLLVVLGIGAIISLVLFRLKSKKIIRWFELRFSKWPRMPLKLKRAILDLLDQLARALSILASTRELAVTIGWTALLWGSIAAANLLVFRAFHLQLSGRQFGITESLFVLGFSMVGSAVPTPGGAAGAFEAATGGALVFLGVELEQAAAVAIVLKVVDFGPAAAFGFFYFLRGEISLARLRELTKPEAVEHAVEDEKIVPTKILDKTNLETVGMRD